MKWHLNLSWDQDSLQLAKKNDRDGKLIDVKAGRDEWNFYILIQKSEVSKSYLQNRENLDKNTLPSQGPNTLHKFFDLVRSVNFEYRMILNINHGLAHPTNFMTCF